MCHDQDHLATPSEARAEYARNAGREDTGRAWILTPWDTWEANPFYHGPAVRHPEDDSGYDEGQAPGDDLGERANNDWAERAYGGE